MTIWKWFEDKTRPDQRTDGMPFAHNRDWIAAILLFWRDLAAVRTPTKIVTAVHESSANCPRHFSRPARWWLIAREKSFILKGYASAYLEDTFPSRRNPFSISDRRPSNSLRRILLLEEQGQAFCTRLLTERLPIADYGHKITSLQLLNHTTGCVII